VVPDFRGNGSRDLFPGDLDSRAQRLAADVPAEFDESLYASNLRAGKRRAHYDDGVARCLPA